MRRTLHLVRGDGAPATPLADRDTVVYMVDGGYFEAARPGLERRAISPDELIQRIFAADLVVTW